mmetsp:Transcript_14354/g.33041  ORF Transcript_14354/g.33041 Transcript_14354/m.33041 type:complete len:85 (+) Transcript_14354:472-726(+)
MENPNIENGAQRKEVSRAMRSTKDPMNNKTATMAILPEGEVGSEARARVTTSATYANVLVYGSNEEPFIADWSQGIKRCFHRRR